MRAVLAGSPIVASHRGRGIHPGAGRLLAALRAAGARRRAATPSTTRAAVADRELASAIDNPVVTLDGRVESNGNFHGAPVGYVLDFLAIAVADVASMSRAAHRPLPRHARATTACTAFLADDPGVDSGLMIAQYTQAGDRHRAEAARRARRPSTRSRRRAMQEDHVSMGWTRRPQAAPLDRRARAGCSRSSC